MLLRKYRNNACLTLMLMAIMGGYLSWQGYLA